LNSWVWPLETKIRRVNRGAQNDNMLVFFLE